MNLSTMIKLTTSNYSIWKPMMEDVLHCKGLAHMSEKGLQILAKKSLIPFAKGMSLKPCDYFLFGKQHRVFFRILSTRKPNVLDLVLF